MVTHRTAIAAALVVAAACTRSPNGPPATTTLDADPPLVDLATVYPVARCLLRKPVAAALARVQGRLAARGVGLAVWDCYRPFTVQRRFWALVPDERWVARPVMRDGVPVDGSRHNRGAAVDVTLVDAVGRALEMPTGFDDFSGSAQRDANTWTPVARRHATLLEQAMVAEGFAPLPTEWWHYDGPEWRRYGLLDVPLE